MKYNLEVVLEENEIIKCVEFGKRFAAKRANKSSKDFGSTRVNERDLTDKTADTIAGKLGEYAFMKFCYRYGLAIEVDFSITDGKMNIDNGQDISLCNHQSINTKFDIKESKKYAQWLLIESHKIDENIIEADVYILVKIDLPKNIETNLDAFNINKIDAKISGYALKSDFFDLNGTPWFRYKRSMSPLKVKFVDAICKQAIKNKMNTTPFEKGDLVSAYKEISGNFLNKEDKFLAMTQKAELNFGLPVSKLRHTDQDIERLLKMIAEDNIPECENLLHKALSGAGCGS